MSPAAATLEEEEEEDEEEEGSLGCFRFLLTGAVCV
jgi:hypothetical protein